MSCLLKRFLPFALTLAIGVALVSIIYRATLNKQDSRPLEVASNASHNRTWLYIHYMPAANFPTECYKYGSDVMRLNVSLDAGGYVSQVTPDTNDPMRGRCINPAIVAATYIRFTPATEDGKPVSMVGKITYGVGESYVDGFDIRTGRPWSSVTRFGITSDFEITSVEGAQETEGWRVIHE